MNWWEKGGEGVVFIYMAVVGNGLNQHMIIYMLGSSL